MQDIPQIVFTFDCLRGMSHWRWPMAGRRVSRQWGEGQEAVLIGLGGASIQRYCQAWSTQTPHTCTGHGQWSVRHGQAHMHTCQTYTYRHTRAHNHAVLQKTLTKWKQFSQVHIYLKQHKAGYPLLPGDRLKHLLLILVQTHSKGGAAGTAHLYLSHFHLCGGQVLEERKWH